MLSHVLSEKKSAVSVWGFDLASVVADIEDPRVRILGHPIGRSLRRSSVKSRCRDRHRKHVETVTVKEIVSFPDDLMHRTALDLHRSDGMRLRASPALVNFLRFASETDTVDFSRGRQGPDGDRHRVAFAFDVKNIVEEKSFSLALVEAPKLPTNQRHQLRVFVDSLFDSDEFPALFKIFQMFPEILHRRQGSFSSSCRAGEIQLRDKSHLHAHGVARRRSR